MKQVIAVIKWTWCAVCMVRRDFVKKDGGWVCTACGGKG